MTSSSASSPGAAVPSKSAPSPALDRGRRSGTFARVNNRELLDAQDWASITAKVAKYAYKKTGKRSWRNAKELAQDAIFKTLEHPESWDPENEPILKHVCLRVFSILANSRRLKRNTFEVAMCLHPDPEGVEDDRDEGSLDEKLDQNRQGEMFRSRFAMENEGDEIAGVVIELLMRGVFKPAAQAAESGATIEQIRAARRRVFARHDNITAAMARELDDEEEVAQ